MGIYTDLLTNTTAWDSGTNGNGVNDMTPTDAAITDEIKTFKAKQGDVALGANFAARDEVQSIAQYIGLVESGNFTLTFSLASGDTFTTANISFNASGLSIENAINNAATAAAVTGWDNGDIHVDLTTNLNDADATITFEGVSVSEARHSLTVLNDVGLADGGPGPVTVTTYGQADRTVWAVMESMALIDGGPPVTGETNGSTVNATRTGDLPYPRQETLQALAIQAAIEDGNDDIYQDLMDLFKQRHAV